MRPPQNPPPSPVSARAEISPGFWLDSRLALWIAAERLLVVADLHWGYAASHRARGNLLPMWGDDEIESRLRSLIADYAPAEMLWLGDIVHAAEGSAGAERFLRNSPTPVTLLAGNHDRRWRTFPTAPVSSLRRGPLFFHHGDQRPLIPSGAIEVVGHHHPAISWGDNAGFRVKLPALVACANRLILPAFSPWAAGTPWNEQLTAADTLWVIASSRIFPFTRRAHPSAVPSA